MQGTVFTFFSDLVIDTYGMKMWDDILSEVGPESQGIYTSALQYDDGELMNLVSALSAKTGCAVNELIKVFGVYLFPRLAEQSPVKISKDMSMKALLKMVGSVIHSEVKRLYPTAYLPSIRYEDIDVSEGNLHYQSTRQLCMLCEGLIAGASQYLGLEVSVHQTQCMHEGDDHCILHIQMQ